VADESAGAAPAADDWAAETADKLDQFVTTIRSQTTDRLVVVARALVFGLLAAVMGLMALLLVVVGLVRGLDALIPEEVWLTYLVLGAIFTLAGLFLWTKRKPRPERAA
jgi:hypothetical protein